MKMWPDETDRPRVVKSGSVKGTIVNYCPPRTDKGMARLMRYNSKLAAATGRCPTCGQSIKLPKLKKSR